MTDRLGYTSVFDKMTNLNGTYNESDTIKSQRWKSLLKDNTNRVGQ